MGSALSLYTKKALTVEAQVELLQERGMQGDPERMKRKLAVVNYYRLSGYWFPFKTGKGEELKEGTTFDTIWNRYCFDRKLRLQVLDAIERVEVAIRARLAYYHAHEHGAFGYASAAASLPDFLNQDERQRFADAVGADSSRSKERFVEHYNLHYSEQAGVLPIWIFAEVTSFGTLCRLYRACAKRIRQQVATTFLVNEGVLESWIVSLNCTRNICAHHGRLWNRILPIKPVMPRQKKRPEWHSPVVVNNQRIFGTLTILGYMLSQVAPKSQWKARVVALIDEHTDIPTVWMGFPHGWRESPLWALEEE